MIENKVVRRILGPKRESNWRMVKCTMRNFIICMLHQILLVQSNQGAIAYGIHGRYGKSFNILVGNLKERDHLEYLGIDGSNTLKWILKLEVVMV